MSLTYPVILTKSNWDKQKGIVAKVFSKETGLGIACTKAEEAFKKIHWAAFDGAAGAKLPTYEGMQQFKAGMKTEHDKNLIPAREAALALSRLATTVEGQFKASKLIPSSSTEHVKKMATEAMNFATALKSAPDAGLRALDAAMAKKAEIPKLKAAIGSGGFGAVEGHAKVYAAFRDFLAAQHATDQLSAYQAAKMNTSGGRAVEFYLKYIKVGSPSEANVPASLRKQFDDKYAKYVQTKKEGEMSGLPWADVASKIKNEMIGPMVGGFVAQFDKFYAKYV